MVKNMPVKQKLQVGKIPWRQAWEHTPVFLPGEFRGQRSLADPSPWAHKELDTTERLTYTHQERVYQGGPSQTRAPSL